jgi:replicative DNA helicase
MSADRYEQELNDLIGEPYDPPPLRLHADAEPDIPDARQMSHEQYCDAVDRLFEDSRTYPAFPWPSLDTITGPLAPEELVLVAGRTGGGKSLFMQNVFNAFIEDGLSVLYIGLEQSPKILKAKWACLRTGVSPRLVLKPQRHEYGTEDHILARTKVLEEMRDYQELDDVARRALFAATRFIDRANLERWTRRAVEKYGTQVVIVDHIDRIHHGDGKNSFHEMSETVRLAKELAVRHQIVMLVASQVGRPHDKTERFTPPALHELRGGGTKEEEADEVLTVFQPLRSDLNAKQMAEKLHQVRIGACPDADILEPNTMAVRELKNRIDGAVRGRQTKLAVERGVVKEIPERDKYKTTYDGQGHRV